jgi:hypothetical protein
MRKHLFQSLAIGIAITAIPFFANFTPYESTAVLNVLYTPGMIVTSILRTDNFDLVIVSNIVVLTALIYLFVMWRLRRERAKSRIE